MLIITLRLLNHNSEPGLLPGLVGCFEKKFLAKVLADLVAKFRRLADIIQYSTVDVLKKKKSKHRVEPDYCK